MQKRNVLNSPRLLELKKRRHKAILNKVFILFFCFFILFFILTYFSRLNKLNISEIQISGNKILDTEVLKTEINDIISKKYLWVFPKTNIMIYPENDIRSDLLAKYKRINTIDLSIKNNKILSVSIIEREGLYTWCGKNTPEVSDLTKINNEEEKCYFVDKDGYIFDEAPYFSGEVYFKFYGSPVETGHPDQNASYYMKDNFKRLTTLHNILVNMDLKPVALFVKENDDFEVFLSNGTSPIIGHKILFKMDSDFEKVAENLKAALDIDPLKTEIKNKYSSLSYIDLRFGNKVYYKFK